MAWKFLSQARVDGIPGHLKFLISLQAVREDFKTLLSSRKNEWNEYSLHLSG